MPSQKWAHFRAVHGTDKCQCILKTCPVNRGWKCGNASAMNSVFCGPCRNARAAPFNRKKDLGHNT